jgi:hypothetical protein
MTNIRGKIALASYGSSSVVQTLFACLITLQFVVVAAHDLVDIPGWIHGSNCRRLWGDAGCGWR